MIIDIEDEENTYADDDENDNVPSRCTVMVSVEVDDVSIELLQGDFLKANCDALWLPISRDFLLVLKGSIHYDKQIKES